MGWEVRKGRRYYYRSRWENGRTVKEYFGCGEEAELAARLDAEAAAARQMMRADSQHTKAELAELDASLERLDRTVHTLFCAAMLVAGFHCHRGQWRRKMNTPESSNDAPLVPVPPAEEHAELAIQEKMEEFDELVARARRGDREALKQVRPVLQHPPAVDALGGNVANLSLRLSIMLITEKNLLAEAAMRQQLDTMRRELAGPEPSPLVRLVADRVVTMWFHLHRLEIEATAAGCDNTARFTALQNAISTQQKRYFAAIRELVLLRREAAPVLDALLAPGPSTDKPAG